MDFSYTARGIANAIWNATRDGTWRSDEQVEGLAEELAHRIHAERLQDMSAARVWYALSFRAFTSSAHWAMTFWVILSSML